MFSKTKMINITVIVGHQFSEVKNYFFVSEVTVSRNKI